MSFIGVNLTFLSELLICPYDNLHNLESRKKLQVRRHRQTIFPHKTGTEESISDYIDL